MRRQTDSPSLTPSRVTTFVTTAAVLDALEEEWREVAALANDAGRSRNLRQQVEAVHVQCLRLDRIMDALMAAERSRPTIAPQTIRNIHHD
jgi:hypothetical protein